MQPLVYIPSMPILLEFKLQCDKCGDDLCINAQVTNVEHEPRFDLTPPEGWEVKDTGWIGGGRGTFKTRVVCPRCQ